MTERTVVVGASVAGVRTAQAMRSEGYAGEIVIVGEEAGWPYDKPPLSKGLLAGTTAEPTLLSGPQAESYGVQLLLGRRATRVDVAAQAIELTGDEWLRFDNLVVATGARARPSPWGQPPGVHLLRTLHDAQRLRSDLLSGGHLVVVGGGFIGSEVASTARTLGLDVTVVDPLPVPMGRLLGDEVGRLLVDLHDRHGARMRLGTGVEAIDGERGDLHVRLTDGTTVRGSTVVVGIGAEPNDEWLADSGLLVEGGLVCDEHCRAVGNPHVYAAGDVARWYNPDRGTHMRIEHWTNAVEQAACVAHNLTHPDDQRSYTPVEYVWSDQYNWRIQVAGHAAGVSEHVLVGDTDSGRFAALYPGEAGLLRAAVTVNWPRATVTCRRSLRAGGSLAEVEATLASQASQRTTAPVSS